MINKRRTGAVYEAAAADYLKNKGYKILEMNYRIRSGEIDIIAEGNGGIIVYCEVKYRTSGKNGSPFEAVDINKQRRICRTAFYHYTKHGYGTDRACRFDVIGIYGDGRIEHIENAFEYRI